VMTTMMYLMLSVCSVTCTVSVWSSMNSIIHSTLSQRDITVYKTYAVVALTTSCNISTRSRYFTNWCTLTVILLTVTTNLVPRPTTASCYLAKLTVWTIESLIMTDEILMQHYWKVVKSYER